MSKHRKKPVVIEARQWDGSRESATDICEWMNENHVSPFAQDNASGDLVFGIVTLEGVMIATPGDWIIQGVQGEFYPCKPDIFEATYEQVDEDDSGPLSEINMRSARGI